MTRFFKGCLGVVAALIAVQFALADVKAGVFSECSPCGEVFCDPCDPCNPCDAVCGKKSQWNVGGWAEVGLWANQWGRTNSYGPGGVSPGNSQLLSNVRHTGVQASQIWLFAERTLDTRRGFDVGGRVDFLYGTDGIFTQSDGLEFRSRTPGATRWGEGDYYASFAQIYAEAGYRDVSVKAGKFLTPFGSESIMAPNRFFYSLSYAFSQLPVTHTGVVGTWAPSEKFSLIGGWVNGADMTFYDGDNNAAIFGATFKPNKKVSLSYVGAIGQDKWGWGFGGWSSVFDISLTVPNPFPFGPPSITAPGEFPVGVNPFDLSRTRDYFLQSVIVNLKPNKRWDYTFEWTLRNVVNGNLDIDPRFAIDYGPASYDLGPFGTFVIPGTEGQIPPGGVSTLPIKRYDGAYGINQELIYTVNKKWAIGGRVEWMHTYGRIYPWLYSNGGAIGAAVGNAVRFDSNFYGYTLAVNWTPNDWLLVRPEVRYDKVYGGGNPFDANTRDDQVSGGVSAVVKF